MEFSSVDDFLRRAVSAKDDKRQKLSDKIGSTLEDEGTYAVPVEIHDAIQNCFLNYGDEVFKQVAMYALGKWAKPKKALDCIRRPIRNQIPRGESNECFLHIIFF